MDLIAGLAVIVGLVLLSVRWLAGGRQKGRARRPASERSSFTFSESMRPLSGRPDRASGPWKAVGVPTKSPGDARWVAPGATVAIADIKIDRGLFYFGSSLPTNDGYGTENALINPALRIGPWPGNISGNGVPYYPSYSALDVESRRAFLEWLARRRDDPNVHIGYVFIYFYGLERRLFLDQAAADYETIVAEVQRLLGIYGGNRSFQQYASAFLDAASALTNTFPATPSIDPETKPPEIPVRLRGAIGVMLKRNEPITADWALAWYASSPDFALRTPAVRCCSEFVALFRRRFNTRFPRGLSIRVPRRNLSARYRAASGTFTVQLHGDFETLPDVISVTAPLSDIDPIVAECTEALEPYSRLIGRNPSAHSTLAAQLCLPRELLEQPQPGGLIAQTKQRLEAMVPKSSAMVRFGELASLLQVEAKAEDKNSKAETVAVASALENLGFAVEPDPRHGGPIPPREAEVMLFRRQSGEAASAAPSPDFVAARSQVEIAVLVATADGDLDGDEARAVISQIRAMSNLSDFQRARLIGYLGYLVRHPPNARAIGRFKERSLSERKAIANVAVMSAAANGHLDVSEIKLLERTYRTLGLKKDDLYRELHELEAEDDEPPVVSRADPVRGVPIPPPPSRSSSPKSVRLNRDRIAKIQAETAAVHGILDEVFNEAGATDNPVEPPVAIAPASKGPITVFSGLDDRHSSLLEEIVSLDCIKQEAFSELARKHGLFAAGAIETINEWSFQRFEEALLDDGEPIEIAHHLIRVSGPTSLDEHVS
jgi:tellurite resistance protein